MKIKWFWVLWKRKSPVQHSSFRYEQRHVQQGQKQIKGQKEEQSLSTEKEKPSWMMASAFSTASFAIRPTYHKEELVQRKRLGLQSQGFSLHLQQPLELKQQWKTATWVDAKRDSRWKAATQKEPENIQHFSYINDLGVTAEHRLWKWKTKKWGVGNHVQVICLPQMGATRSMLGETRKCHCATAESSHL